MLDGLSSLFAVVFLSISYNYTVMCSCDCDCSSCLWHVDSAVWPTWLFSTATYIHQHSDC